MNSSGPVCTDVAGDSAANVVIRGLLTGGDVFPMLGSDEFDDGGEAAEGGGEDTLSRGGRVESLR